MRSFRIRQTYTEQEQQAILMALYCKNKENKEALVKNITGDIRKEILYYMEQSYYLAKYMGTDKDIKPLEGLNLEANTLLDLFKYIYKTLLKIDSRTERLIKCKILSQGYSTEGLDIKGLIDKGIITISYDNIINMDLWR